MKAIPLFGHLRPFLLTFLLFLTVPPPLTAQAPNMTATIIADIQQVREVKLSPDGNTIAYTLSVPGGEMDTPGKSWTEIHTVRHDGKAPTTYVAKPNSGWNLRWSPDGKYLYFLARRAAHDSYTQVYRVAVAGGEAELVTEHDASIRHFELSPDGASLAFSSRDGLTAAERRDAKQGRDWIVYGVYTHFTRLYAMDLNNGKIRRIFEEDLEVSSFTWAPNNATLVFRAALDPETDSGYMFQKIYRVNASGGKPEVVCETAGKLGHIEVSPDSKQIAFCGAVDISDPLAQSLFVAPLQGKAAPRNLTPDAPFSATSFCWVNPSSLLLQATEGVYTSMYALDANTATRRRLFGESAILGNFAYDAKSGHFATAAQTPAHPAEVFSGEIAPRSFQGNKLSTAPQRAALQRLTKSNPDLEQVQMGKQEVVEWKGPGGLKIEGILTYPVGYQSGKAYPLLLQIHGGPEGVSRHGFNTRVVYPVQLYATHGFFVLEPNYRGSQGRGVSFSKADHQDLAGKEFEDVLAGIDMLAERKLIDPKRVGTGGFSYGGYFSAWAATRYSQRFKAAMVGAGITNWISFTGTTDIIQENSLVHWDLWWYDHMKLVWDRSPMAHINNSKTPTLIVHGENDLRVPPGQGIELYNGLKLKNTATELVIYKRQPHGIREWAAGVDYMNRTLAWFKKYVK